MHRATIRIRSSPAKAGRSSPSRSSSRIALVVSAAGGRSPSLGVARRSSSSCSSSAIRRAQFRLQPNASCRPPTGSVLSVERARDPYLDRDALKISVFMNVFNVHSNRSPVDGDRQERVVSRRQLRQRGARQGIARKRAQCAAHAHARRARRDLRADRGPHRAAHPLLREAGRALARGQRYGFIRFGSRVDVYLPPDARAAGRGRRHGRTRRRRSWRSSPTQRGPASPTLS